MKIIHFYTNFDVVGGAQSMVITLFEGMKSKGEDVQVCGFPPYEKIHTRYKKTLEKKDYIQFSFATLFRIKKSVLVSHHRKITTYLLLFSKVFYNKTNVVHVAHSEFSNLKRVSLFPKKIIAVSNSVKQNLINTFNVKENTIKVIYNGIPNDYSDSNVGKPIDSIINIVYPARIDAGKKQLDLVKEIQKTDLDGILISFCGVGDLFDDLKRQVGSDQRFMIKGMVDDMEKEYKNAHFTILFSKKEGLPVSLIESCKYGLPMICNDIGGSLEILETNYNGYLVNTYDQLILKLRELRNLSQTEYDTLCINSKKVFQEKFTQDQMIFDYLEVISKYLE